MFLTIISPGKMNGLTKNQAPPMNLSIPIPGLYIFTVGAELGYQFVFWKRLTLDLVLVGPGLANYDIKATIDGNLSDGEKRKFTGCSEATALSEIPGNELCTF
jgi:hypothetical protein